MDWFQIGKGVHRGCILSPWLTVTMVVTSVQSTSCEISGWIKHKLESRLPGEISVPQICRWYHPYGRKQKGTKEPPDEGESSVQFSNSVVSNCLWPHGLQHARLPCPSPTPGAYSNSYPSSWWCHPTILSSVIPFSSCLQSFPASGSFPMSQFFASGGQRIGVSASASSLQWILRTDFL